MPQQSTKHKIRKTRKLLPKTRADILIRISGWVRETKTGKVVIWLFLPLFAAAYTRWVVPLVIDVAAKNPVSRWVLGVPAAISCDFSPIEPQPVNGEPLQYNVVVRIDFSHREKQTGLLLLRNKTSEARLFLVKGSIAPVSGVSLEKLFLDDSGKRAIGLQIGYQDRSSGEGVFKFIVEHDGRRTEEECQDFSLLER